MAQYKAFSPKVEVNGQTVLSIVDGMGAYKIGALQILEENGIKDPKPNQWYSQQAWLNSFKAIAEKIGNNTLFVIGKKIPENADFPPDIDSIEAALQSIDVAYHMNHKGGEIGEYKYKKPDEEKNEVEMVCNNPYPCDFDRGIIEATARKFAPPNKATRVRVTHDNTKPCRKKGNDSCTYHVTW